jgi:hypothetical protein
MSRAWHQAGSVASLSVIVVLLGACSSTGAPSPSVGAPASVGASATTPSSAPSVAASASPSAAASTSAAASGAADCLDKQVWDLLRQHLNDLASLPKAQQDQILTAIENYDFGADANGKAWQQKVVAAFKAGNWKPMELGSLVGGFVTFKVCA